MHNTEEILYSPQVEILFRSLIQLYPKQYRKQFGNEIYLLFQDMYKEEIAQKGHASLLFWLFQITDMCKSILEQQKKDIQRKGMKNYLQNTLHISIYSVLGAILLIPFSLSFLVDMIVVLTTGSRNALYGLYHSPLYTLPILPIWILGFPLFAVLLNLIPLFSYIRKNKTRRVMSAFVVTNPLALFIIVVGIGILFLIFAHDFVPCIANNVLRKGPLQIIYFLQICRNA